MVKAMGSPEFSGLWRAEVGPLVQILAQKLAPNFLWIGARTKY
jgi:hypothetical protein